IRGDGIDILIDLMGYTGLARTACVAMRPAPIQVNWLGYAGTMGAPFIDYLIGDAALTPPEHAAHYRERLVRLPHSFMPTDRRQAQFHGIDPARLVFSRHVSSKAEHLARLRLADLFLDTLYYNAHATAADALWAGLPVLTCPGGAFASRVGASLATAAGLAEL